MPAHPDEMEIARNALQSARDEVLAQLDELEERLQPLVEQRDALAEIVDRLDDLLGRKTHPSEIPSGYAAVEAVARHAIAEGDARGVDGALTVAEIVAELESRGWAPRSDNPESAVRASIRRLRERDGRWGLYKGRLYYHDREGVPESEA